MTFPASPRSQASARRIWLERYVPIQRAADRRLSEALRNAASDAEAEVKRVAGKPGIGAAVRRSQLIGARGAITEILTELFRQLGVIVKSSQADAAQAAIDASIDWEKKVLAAIEPNKAKREELINSLRQTADVNVQAMISRVLNNELTISKQVFRTRSATKVRLNRLINSAIARGDSADDLAKQVREFISPDTPGGVTYAARRLARTEINNAFHAQAITAARERPWVHSVRWNLSRAHRVRTGCRCELLAQQGLFAAQSVPAKPHPQCLCYITPELADMESILAEYRAGAYDEWLARHGRLAA